MNVSQLDNFHHTKPGYVVFGLVEAALAYLFGSLAINSGSLWQWALTALFLLGAARNLVLLLGQIRKGLRR